MNERTCNLTEATRERESPQNSILWLCTTSLRHDYGALKDEMLHDLLVVGIVDAALSETGLRTNLGKDNETH